MGIVSLFLCYPTGPARTLPKSQCWEQVSEMPGVDLLSQAPGVLILGGDQVGKKALIERLPGTTASATEASGAMLLDTKYYTALVRLNIANDSGSPDQEYEGVILVFDATRETTFNTVKAWAGREDNSEAEIKICVANKIDKLVENGAVKRPSWLLSACNWCNSELYEYIEVALTAPEVDGTLEFDGEAQGVSRVHACLQAHAWPGLKMKERGAPPQPYNTATDKADANQVEAQTSGAQRDTSRPLAERDSLATRVPCSATSEGVQGQSEEELENDMNQFESLISEVASVRGRLQGLPDAERRTAAEAMTKQLLAHFAIDEEDTESEEE